MAEDNRAVAEGSAPGNLQGGMGLHLRGRGLQLSPYEESGDASNVSRSRSVLAGPKTNPRDTSGCSQNPSRITKSLRRERESKSRSPFFRSLLGCARLRGVLPALSSRSSSNQYTSVVQYIPAFFITNFMYAHHRRPPR